ELEYGYRYRLFDEGPRQRLEGSPREPIPGVQIVNVRASTTSVGLIRYDFGPPARLAFTDDRNRPLGMPVEIRRDGTYPLSPTTGQELIVQVTRGDLPLEAESPQERTVVIRSTLRYCFKYDVRNITLVETAEVPGGRPGRGWNLLRVYLAEVPE